MDETWKPVVGYEQYYEVSDRGRVRSKPRTLTSRSGNPYVKRGTVLRAGTDRKIGYQRVGLCVDGKLVTRKVHRLVLEALVGPAPKRHVCCHLDGDPANNHLTNLRWDSVSANCADKELHGRVNRGARNGKVKMTEDVVREVIKPLLRQGLTQKEVAARAGVTVHMVRGVARGRTWAWVA